ncbi:sulfurtransferase TusA family protein [Mycobacterium kansasii]
MHATDRGAKSDLTAWAKSTGNEMLEQAEDGGVLKFWIRKG